MSLRHHFANEMPQNISEDEDLHDDSTGYIPMIGLKTPAGLRDRFLQRLSKFAAASVQLEVDENQQSINIYLTRKGRSPQVRLELDTNLKTFVDCMECSMIAIAKHTSDHKQERAKDELWDAVLIYCYSSIDHIIQSLNTSFTNHQVTYEEFVTKMFGINDEAASKLDRELGDLIISLRHAVQSYDRSVKQCHELIHFASRMTKDIQHLHPRLKYLLLKTKFANEIYDLVVTLGFPERAYNTFIRAATTSSAFAKLKIHLKSTPSSSPQKNVSFGASRAIESAKPSTPPKSILKTNTNQDSSPTPSPTGQTVRTVRPQLSPVPRKPVARQPKNVSGRTASSGTTPTLVSQNEILRVVRPYLEDEDRVLGLHRLHSASKQDTAQLAGAVLRGKLLPKSTNAWHTFGFVTTRNEDEERILGGLFAEILKEAQNPQSIFRELVHAVETHSLNQLIHSKEFSHILNDLPPSLQTFLTSRSDQQPTVWRLKQFINDADNDEPHACLKRDYGFKYCKQREEVQRIKDIYWNLLKSTDPMDLHNACVHGRLYEFASNRGFASPDQKRLLQNDYPASFLGFDNDRGLASYQKSLFNRRL